MGQGHPDYDAFVSYSREDEEWARYLARRLRRRRRPDSTGNLRVFLDLDSIAVGTNWVTAIEAAVRDSRHIVPIFTESYFESSASGWELLQKLIHDLDAQNRSILPVLLKRCDIPPRLRHIQYLDFRWSSDPESDEFESLFEELVTAVKGMKPGRLVRLPALKQQPGSKLMPKTPYFVYLSDTKLDMLEEHITWNRHRGLPQVASDRVRLQTLSEVVADLESRDQIGAIDSKQPYLAGEVELNWGILRLPVADADIRIVFFMSASTEPALLMAGSVHHLVGATPRSYVLPGSYGYSGSGLPGIFYAMRFARGNWSKHVDNSDWLLAMTLCQQKGYLFNPPGEPPISFPRQRLNFVARSLKKIRRPKESKVDPWLHEELQSRAPDEPDSDVLICTPLYVALSDDQ